MSSIDSVSSNTMAGLTANMTPDQQDQFNQNMISSFRSSMNEMNEKQKEASEEMKQAIQEQYN